MPPGKELLQWLEGNPPLLCDLHWMLPIVRSNRIDRPFSTDGLKGHLRLEGAAVLPLLRCHRPMLPHGTGP